MEIKTFEAFSMKDAVKALKKDLGPDAVILSTKEKPSITGSGRVFEVTAARSKTVKSPQTANSDLERSLSERLDSLTLKISHLAEVIPHKNMIYAAESGITDIRRYLIEILRGKNGSHFDNLPHELVPLENHLRLTGISEPNIVDLLKHVQNILFRDKNYYELNKDHIEEKIREEIMKWFYKQIKIAPKWPSNESFAQNHVFIGPYGAGKTSLISKIASQLSKIKDRQIQVITLDQSRLANADQLRVLCKIINVPFVVITNREEWTRLFSAPTFTRDTISLIDTKGFGPKEADFVPNIKAFISKDDLVDFHLVLSTTEKESYSDQSIKTVLPLGISSLNFTKLDQSNTFGEIFNLSKSWSIPLGHFSLGTLIPNDVERATKERVIERIIPVA